MNDVRDPLFRSIRQRLADGINPGLFERFAIELVRPDFPTAVLVAGGSDGGVDGWVHSADQPPVPVVTTTAQNVLRNLKRNLSTYRRQWPECARTAILVTSTKLTATRQRNLTAGANGMGFRLVLFEEEAVVTALYRMPKWRIELLGIPGDPPALSQVPPVRNLALATKPVGRETDLQWLKNTPGDRLLTGQPGTGKTFLLTRYARACDGFFVTSEDAGQIADAVREFQPKTLIVDDAHAYPTLLETVRKTRQQIGANFEIVACAWSGFEECAIEELGVTSENVRELPLLTREEIAEVIRRLGISGPDRLIAYILGQASGRVGLAATLTMRLLAGDWEVVVSGDSLARSVTTSLQQHVNIPLLPVLATFGLGGASGVAIQEVAASLGHSLLELADAAARVGSTGFLAVGHDWSGRRTVRVEPEVLREAAVRKFFFDTSAPLPIEPFLATVADTCEAASTLVGARMQGARVPTMLIRSLLARCSADRPWLRFAALGPREARWVLEDRPKLVLNDPRPFFEHIPEPTIEKLLDFAVGDDRPLNRTPEHGLRRIQDWLKAGPPARGAVDRRRAVIETALRWANNKDSRLTVAERAILFALDPTFGDNTLDPITEEKMTVRWGLLPVPDLEGICKLWPTVLEYLQSKGISGWNNVISHLRHWIFLGGSQGSPEEVYEAMRPFIQAMIDDVVAFAEDHPAVLRAVAEIAMVRGFSYPSIEDDVFMTLFPLEPHPASEDERQEQTRAVNRLAEQWSNVEPAQAIQKLERCVSEARLLDRIYPGHLSFFCWELAPKVEDTFAWIDQITVSRLPGEVLGPFLHEAHRRDVARWLEVSNQLVDQDPWSAVVAEVVLTQKGIPPALLEKACSMLTVDPQTVETLCLRGHVPAPNLRLVLSCDHPGLAGFAAVGEWLCDPAHTVRPEVLAEWKIAVPYIPPGQYVIKEILSAFPEIAKAWLLTQAKAICRDAIVPGIEEAAVSALRLVGVGDWPEVVSAFDDCLYLPELIASAVGGDLRRYRTLLRRAALKGYHLAPLAGPPDPRWARMVVAASQVGYSAEEIASATLGTTVSWHGDESKYWQSWLEALPPKDAPEPALGAVVAILRSNLEDRIREAVKAERLEAIHGRG